MTTLTEIVAAAVVHSSAAALSHFGVTLEPGPVVQPAATPVAERSPVLPKTIIWTLTAVPIESGMS